MNMHILVTIPRREWANSAEEDAKLREGGSAFWSMARRPRDIVPWKSRIYFLRDGRIESSMLIVAVSENEKGFCTTTGRMWEGPYLLHCTDFRDENIEYDGRGFQGFRYFAAPEEGTA